MFTRCGSKAKNPKPVIVVLWLGLHFHKRRQLIIGGPSIEQHVWRGSFGNLATPIELLNVRLIAATDTWGHKAANCRINPEMSDSRKDLLFSSLVFISLRGWPHQTPKSTTFSCAVPMNCSHLNILAGALEKCMEQQRQANTYNNPQPLL